MSTTEAFALVADLPDEADDPADFAEAVGLRYVLLDTTPGMSRRRRGAGFSFHDPDGGLVEGQERQRLLDLVIPPAWTDVWICPDPLGHLQAVGTDDAGRRQYLYHPRWREIRDAEKFRGLASFGEALAEYRRSLATDDEAGPRAQALALAGRLLDRTLVRVGSDQALEEFGTRGLVTLAPSNVRLNGSGGRLRFLAKGEVERDVAFHGQRLRDGLHRMRRRADDRLLHWWEDGERRALRPELVNDHLRDRLGATAKTFRTWGGTVRAAEVLVGHPADAPDAAEVEAIDAAAEALGNTRAVARASYVDPRVVQAWRDGSLHEAHASSRTSRVRSRTESAVLKLLGG